MAHASGRRAGIGFVLLFLAVSTAAWAADGSAGSSPNVPESPAARSATLGRVEEFPNGSPRARLAERLREERSRLAAVGQRAAAVSPPRAPGDPGTISGRVTDASSGLGLQGVEIEVYVPQGWRAASATTDSTGYYEVTGLAAGRYYVRTANMSGYIDQAWSGVVCAPCSPMAATPIDLGATGAANIDFALDTDGGRVSGTITDAVSGDPILACGASVYDLAGASVTWAPCNDFGEYVSAGGLLSGTYYVQTYNWEGYVDEIWDDFACGWCPRGEADLVSVTRGQTTGAIDFQLVIGGSIAGTVTASDTGLPLADVQLWLYDWSGRWAMGAASGVDGSYSFAALPGGSYYIEAAAQSLGYVDELYENKPCGAYCDRADGTPIPVSLGQQTSSIDFGLDPGATITGQVRNAADDAPLQGVSVQLNDADGNYLRSLQVDETGHYSHRGLSPGSYYVQTLNMLGFIDELYNDIRCSFCWPVTVGTPIVLGPGETASGIDFELVQGGRIAGTVTDAVTHDGIQTEVDVYDSSGTWISYAISDSSGAYVTGSGLPQGDYHLVTYNWSGYVDELFDDRVCTGAGCDLDQGTTVSVDLAVTTPGIDFELAKGAIVVGHVSAEGTGAPISGTVRIYDSQARQVAYARVNSAGNYATEGGVPSGAYYARTYNSSGYVDELYDDLPCPGSCTVTGGAQILLTAGTTKTVDFVLSQGGRIAGTVRDESGDDVLPGVWIDVYDAQGRGVGSGYTDVNGAYVSSTGLPTGQYFARSSNRSGYVDELYGGLPCVGHCTVTSGTPIEVIVGSTTGGVDFALAEGGRVSGVVSDGSNGLGLGGVTVEVYDAQGRYLSQSGTNGTGQYEISIGLPAGQYRARTRNGSDYVDELHDDIPCPGWCDVSDGASIDVVVGQTTRVDFALARGGAISGSVTNASTGLPVPVASVEVFDAQGRSIETRSTDPTTGVWATTVSLPAGVYYARSRNGNGLIDELYDDRPCCTVTSGTPIVLAAAETKTGIDFELAPGGRIRGLVTDTADPPNPLAGVSVRIYQPDGVSVTSGVTDASGVYVSAGGLPTGRYFASTDNSGGYADEVYQDRPCLQWCNPTTGTPIDVQVGLTTEGVDFALPRAGGIAGRITGEDSGAALAGANAWLTAEDGSAAWLGADADGDYSAQGLAPGQYRIWAQANDGVHVPEVYEDLPWLWWPWGLTGTPVTVTSDEVTTVDFALAVGGRVRGRVTDAATGAGIPGVSVGFWLAWTWNTATTDANGEYQLASIPQGTYPFVTSNTAGYVDEFRGGVPSTGGFRWWELPAVDVANGTTVEGVDFALSRGGRIAGTVRDASTGDPLPNVTVRIFNDTGYQVTTGKSDAEGAWVSAAGLVPGRYFARTNNESGYVNRCFGGEVCSVTATRNPLHLLLEALPVGGTPIDVTASETVPNVDFALEHGGRIAGHLRTVHGAPLGGTVTVFDAENQIVATATARTGSGSDGDYLTNQGLPPGDYFVVVRNDPYVPKVYDDTTCLGCDPSSGAPVTVVGTADTTGIDFGLELGGRIAGRVSDALTGRGFPVDVQVWSADGTPLSRFDWSTGDFTGGFATAALPSGQYYLKTKNWTGYVDEAYDDHACGLECDPSGATLVTVTAGRVTWDRDFALVRGARITGRVTSISGQPIAGLVGGIYDGEGRLVSRVASDAEGNYASSAGLPDGSYYVATGNEGNYVDEVWPDLPCVGAPCNPLDGTAVVISGGVDATGIDFVLGKRTLSIADVSVVEGHSGTKTASFTVTLSPASHETVTARWTTLDGMGEAGATTANGDYVASSGGLTFAPLETSRTVEVTVNGDARNELDESFSVELRAASHAEIADAQGVGTITNDDPLPSLRISDVTMDEGDAGDAEARLTVTLSAASGRTVMVQYATANGTATVADADYDAASGTLSFLPGTITRDVVVNVNGDAKDEVVEDFSVVLTSPVNATVADDTGIVTLLNEDLPPSVSVADAAVVEGDSGQRMATFTATLTAASGKLVTVSCATSDWTATAADGDYAVTTRVLAFSPGVTSRPCEVPVLGDTRHEDTELFRVDLSGATNAVLGDSQALGTIANDDLEPSVSVGDVSVLEGDGGETLAVFTVTLSAASGKDVAIDYETGDGSATTADGDYLASSGTLMLAAGTPSGIVEVPVYGDTAFELDEGFSLLLTSAYGATIADGTGTATIRNDDSEGCDGAVPVVADGREVALDLAAGGSRWLVFGVSPGHSYSVEVGPGTGASSAPTAALFRGEDGCGPTSTAVVRDTSAIEPATSALRLSTTASGSLPAHRLFVTNGSRAGMASRVSISETSSYSAAWSTNGGYNTYYSLRNTTSATIRARLVLRTTAGAAAAEVTFEVPSGSTASTNTAALAVPRGATGALLVTHDGPAGALVTEAVIANFGMSPAFVQPVRLETVRERR